MYYNFRYWPAFWIGLICAVLIVGTSVKAGTILLTNVGPAVPGGGGGHIVGALLLEDNASFLLLEDGASKLCLEAGCI